MKKLGWLGLLPLLLANPAFAEHRGLIAAERAYQSVDFPATHALAQSALEAGGAARDETARIYVLLGIAAAAQGNGEEAKRDFVIALAIDPTFKLDKGLSPKIRDPYLEAQGYWAAAAERLSLSAKPGNDSAHLIVRVQDKAALVAKLDLRVAAVGVLPRPTFTLAPAAVTRFALPEAVRGRDYEYTVRALDRYGNVLAEQGNDADPQLVRSSNNAASSAPAGPPPVAPASRSYLLPVSLGLAGLGAVAAGALFHVRREQAAQDWNGPGCENPGQTRIEQCQSLDSRRETSERLAIGFYAAGGALITGSIIALVAGRSSEAPEQRGGLLGCAVAGAGVSCSGRF